MIRLLILLGLAVVLLPTFGCGLTGESTLDAMKRRAKALAAANQEKEERAMRKATQDGSSAPAFGAPVAEDQRPEKSPPSPGAVKPSAAQDANVASQDTSPVLGAEVLAIRPPIPAKPEMPLTDIQRRNKSAHNLDQIIKGLNKYAREKGTYPTQAITTKRLGQPLLSWRVEILPYLGYAEFYEEFRREEAWDSPHNLALLPHVPSVFVSPERCDEKTNYLAPHGPGTAWHGIRGSDPLSYADGADTTLIVVEVQESAAVPWTKPADLATDENLRLRLGDLRGEGFLAAFGSGHVAMIHSKISDAQLSWMLSPDGDDYLADRTIIFDATVPDVALVTSDKDALDTLTGDKSQTDGIVAVADSNISSSASQPPGQAGLPAVRLPTPLQKPERIPVPAQQNLADARQRLRGLYEAEYRQCRSPGDRQKLATKMFEDASRLENEAAASFELLQMVREIAVGAGDVTLTLGAVERLETKFELPPLELRLSSLEGLNRARGDSGRSARQLANEAEKVLIAAYEADDYPRALAALKIQVSSLRKINNRAEIANTSAAKAALLEAEAAHKLVPTALSALAVNVENTEANSIAGKYFCLIKSDWEIGLPMLARGEDLKLRILARMDLDPDKSGPQYVQLADQYWELSGDFKQPQRRALQLRAAFHYAAARPLLTGSVDLVKAEKRIEEVSRTYGKQALAGGARTPKVLVAPTADPKDDSG